MAMYTGVATFEGKSFDKNVSPIFNYANDHSLRMLPIQEKLMKETMKQPLNDMMGAPEVMQLLQNFIRAQKMKKVIEVGVYTGFSTLGFALALPNDGKIIALDINKEYADVGRPFWKEAGVEHKIDLRIQAADKTLDELLASGMAGTFDLAFIDADKDNYDLYYEQCLKLMRPGGIIAIDNVLWYGSVLEENPTTPGTLSIKNLNEKLLKDKRIDMSMLVVGDGLTLAFKL